MLHSWKLHSNIFHTSPPLSLPVRPHARKEICRFGAAVLHSEAAFVGGAVAQTVTILVSRQFQPLEGTLVHNGFNGNTQMLEMVD
jgi:hypothetical protein